MNSFDQAELDGLAADAAAEREAALPAQFIVRVERDWADGKPVEVYENAHRDLTDAKLDAQSQHANGATDVAIFSQIDSRIWRVSKRTGRVLLACYALNDGEGDATLNFRSSF